MAKLTGEKIEQMGKRELYAAAKARGIKYGRMSLMQIRDALKANPDEPAPKQKGAKAKKAPPKRKAADGKPSKMDAAIEVMRKNPNLPRKSIIAKFIDDVGLTKAGASTYYTLVQKKLKDK